MPSLVNLKATGLQTQSNQLDLPEGSLSVASNVVIDRDNVIQKRRGFKLYGNSFGSSTDVSKQLMQYRDQLIRHYLNKLQFDNGSGLWTAFPGDFLEPQTGIRIKSVAANNNFYFTTSEGIKKIASATSDLSTATISNAGGIKAIDISTSLNFDSLSGFLPENSTVAYRAVWAIKDVNGNLVLGTPSSRSEIYNPTGILLVQDLNKLLVGLDNATESPGTQSLTDTDYASTLGLLGSASVEEVRTNLIALAQKIDEDIYAPLPAITTAVSSTTPLSITFTFASAPALVVGDTIKIVGVIPDTFNGKYTVSAVATPGPNDITVSVQSDVGTYVSGGTATQIKYQFIPEPDELTTSITADQLNSIQSYMSNIIVTLQASPTSEILFTNLDNFIDPLDITTSVNVNITVFIPQEVINAGANEYFLQLYRSSISTATGSTILSDLVPNDEMKLVYEAFPTQAELTAGVMKFVDVTPEAFAGAFLYSNESTGEGALQVNDAPPFSIDIARFKNVVFYANTRNRQNSLTSLLGVQSMIDEFNSGTTPQITITNGTETITYSFVTGIREVTTITTVADVANSLNGTYFDIYSSNDETKYRFYFKTSGGVDTPPPITIETLVRIDIITNATAGDVASAVKDSINLFGSDFLAEGTGPSTVTITNVNFGVTTDASAGTTGFTVATPTQGTGPQEITDITTVADIADSLNGTYFDIYSANDASHYKFYYRTSGGADLPPAITTEKLVKIDIGTGYTANQVAGKTRDIFNIYGLDFLSEDRVLPTIRIKNVASGATTNATPGTTGFTFNIFQEGFGSSVSGKVILLSSNVSPATAVDETARALVNTINQDPNSPVYAFYISAANGVPGRIQLTAKDLTAAPFYILSNNAITGASFNPNISPTSFITAISSTNPAVITTSVAHGLVNGNTIVISSSNSPTSIDGVWTVTVLSPTTFSIPIDLSAMSAGSYTASYSTTTDTISSENNAKINRIMYSKLDQPEAVPGVNFFDVGDSDKAIIRIFPLRDSLFVFKEEGLYRVSGELAPFTLALFDTSCKLRASDSLGVVANLIFAWTKQGIETVSESGSSLVSRPIDSDIAKLSSNNYPNFKTVTFGLGYESDKSYLVWTINTASDTVGSICYRYSTVTGAWTTYDKENTCGIIKVSDDRLYLGAGDINYTEQERKTFSRLDYADREIDLDFNQNSYFNNKLKFTSVNDFSLGDVLVQDQTMTVFGFNMLLKKLDIDPGVGYTSFFANFQAASGDNLRASLEDLAIQLDTLPLFFNDYFSIIDQKTGLIGSQTISTNPVQITSAAHGLETGRFINISGNTSSPSLNGNWTVTKIDANTFSVNTTVLTSVSDGSFVTLDQSFEDMQGSYNLVIQKLNSDTVVSFTNYASITNTTPIESIVINVNTTTKIVTFNIALPYVVGPVVLFKAYDSTAVYSPVTMGDPLGYKHIREATVMFEDKTFTNAILSFGSDLLPEYNPIPFNGDGNGIYGHNNFGEGFFGGNSHGAPFRTYIPRNNQRCRALNIKLEHNVARENIVVYGISLTGEVGYSSRAYRG